MGSFLRVRRKRRLQVKGQNQQLKERNPTCFRSANQLLGGKLKHLDTCRQDRWLCFMENEILFFRIKTMYCFIFLWKCVSC